MKSEDIIRAWNPTDRPNFTIVECGPYRVAYSYQTIIAFGYPWTVTVNYWGPTTGKHLKWLDNGRKMERLENDEFRAKLEEYLQPIADKL